MWKPSWVSGGPERIGSLARRGVGTDRNGGLETQVRRAGEPEQDHLGGRLSTGLRACCVMRGTDAECGGGRATSCTSRSRSRTCPTSSPRACL
eukprot:6054-Rhodomonas_salina.1